MLKAPIVAITLLAGTIGVEAADCSNHSIGNRVKSRIATHIGSELKGSFSGKVMNPLLGCWEYLIYYNDGQPGLASRQLNVEDPRTLFAIYPSGRAARADEGSFNTWLAWVGLTNRSVTVANAEKEVQMILSLELTELKQRGEVRAGYNAKPVLKRARLQANNFGTTYVVSGWYQFQPGDLVGKAFPRGTTEYGVSVGLAELPQGIRYPARAWLARTRAQAFNATYRPEMLLPGQIQALLGNWRHLPAENLSVTVRPSR